MNDGIALPAPLQPWADWLGWFGAPLAPIVAELLQRMQPLLGHTRGTRQAGTPEPDGVDDLRRRGPYERLLASEWLLAGELPDEFIRRAATGEHLFLAPRPRARRSGHLIVALFDAGPWQLGAPRLAQLAWWILLARRARESGGSLRWGVLQQPGHWHAADDAKDLRRLLAARRFDAVEPAHREQWAAWLDAQAPELGECWLVGGELQQLPPPQGGVVHAMAVRTGLAGDTLQVQVRSGARLRELQLPLPSPRPAAQLLKGEFDERPVASPKLHARHDQRLSLKFAPVIAPGGQQVAVPLLDGHGAMIFHVPRSGDRQPGRPKLVHWMRAGEPLAAGFAGKSLGVLLSVRDTLLFWQVPGLGTQARPPREQFEATAGSATLLPCIWQRNGLHTRAYALDAARRLVYWVPEPGDRPRGPMLLNDDVLAMAPAAEQSIVYAYRSDGQLWLRMAGLSGRDKDIHALPGSGAADKVLLSGGAAWAHQLGACAFRLAGSGTADDAGESWVVHPAPLSPRGAQVDTEAWTVHLPAGARAVGLVRTRRCTQARLVVKSARGTDITLYGKLGAEATYSVQDPIVRASVCPSSGMVALLTHERALHVYSVPDRAVRLVAHGSADTPAGDDAST